MQCGNNKEAEACQLREQELVSVRCMRSIQIESRDNTAVQIIIRIIRAATGNLSVDETAPALFNVLEDVVNQRITIYGFLNIMVFSITLVRSYGDASTSSGEDIAVWITEQAYSVIAAAYQRYHINNWIQEQSGWTRTGVLRLVREEYQTLMDYGTGGQGFMRRRQAVAAGAGMICIITTIASIAIWYYG